MKLKAAHELWFAEAERRLEELRSGKGIEFDEAFRTAREALKR
jgi:hypothetical protein